MQPLQDKDAYRQFAAESWLIWRLVFEGGLAMADADSMDIEELHTANAALDLWIEAKNRQQGEGGQ